MNLILQTWDTNRLPAIAVESRKSLGLYAIRCGAEYEMLSGSPFCSGMSPQAQKLAMLNEEFDEYEAVAMFDCDMFAVRGLKESIFEQPGHGFHQQQAHRRVSMAFPGLSSPSAGFYGGPLYRFSREERKALRHEMDFASLRELDNGTGGWDEGQMHWLAMRAKLPAVYLSELWAWSSHFPMDSGEKFVHVRNRPIRDKLANYRSLVERGVLE